MGVSNGWGLAMSFIDLMDVGCGVDEWMTPVGIYM